MSNDFLQDTVEALHPFDGGAPAAGAFTGAWADLAYSGKVGVMIHADGAAEELTVTLQQAKDTSGTDAKALNLSRVYHKVGAATVYTKETAEKAADFAIPSGDAGIVVVEVDEADLDINNDFKVIQCNVAGSTARIISVVYLLRGPSYKPAGDMSAS